MRRTSSSPTSGRADVRSAASTTWGITGAAESGSNSGGDSGSAASWEYGSCRQQQQLVGDYSSIIAAGGDDSGKLGVTAAADDGKQQGVCIAWCDISTLRLAQPIPLISVSNPTFRLSFFVLLNLVFHAACAGQKKGFRSEVDVPLWLVFFFKFHPLVSKSRASKCRP